jgi:hypothetical protein
MAKAKFRQVLFAGLKARASTGRAMATFSIQERFLDCACRHPSQKARRMKEKSRQTPLGMTAAG